MSNWADSLAAMDEALFSEFGTSAEIAGQTVNVVRDDEHEQYGAMAGNFIYLSLPKSSGVRPRKGDAVTYNKRRYVISDVPIYRDELITIGLK